MLGINLVTSQHRIAPELMNMLVCPQTRGPLEYDQSAQRLISRQAGLAFPIIDGVPILLIDQAEKIEE